MPHDDMMIRRADFSPTTYNAEAGTIEAVASTFADVQRNGYVERLNPAAINPADVVGVPFMDNHRQGSARDVLGSVIAARMEPGRLVVTIKRTSAADADPAWQRIADGSIRGVSIGYPVRKWRETTEGGQRVRTAEEWGPIREISVAPINADLHATFRSQDMPDDQITTQPTPEEAETQRRSEIRIIARQANLGSEWADGQIDTAATTEAARAAAFTEMQTRSAARPVIRVHGSADDPAVIVARTSEALHVGMSGGEVKPEIRPFMGNSFLDIARDSLARAGVSTRGLSRDEVFTRAGEMTTSDFPLIVSNAMGKTALASYTAAESPLKKLGRQRTLSNFKPSTSIRAGELGRLEELDESGEIKHVTRAESGESMQLSTYAAGLNVSRKLLIDDDLGMLGDMTAAFGEAAAQKEADILVALVTGNPDMADGNPVFDASRGNIAASGEPLSSVTAGSALAVARKHFRQVKGTDGQTLINVSPKYLLCGPENEEAAERLLTSIYAATVDDVNVHANKLTLLIEPRITDLSWFLFSDPARLAALQYGYLSSAQGVQIQRAEAWSTLGLKYRAWLDFSAGWLEWRAAYLNEGA